MTWITVFIITALTEILLMKHTLAAIAGKAVVAANYAALYHIVCAIALILVVQTFWYIIPIALGSWAGIYITVKNQPKLCDK